jgi:hypothetical protein
MVQNNVINAQEVELAHEIVKRIRGKRLTETSSLFQALAEGRKFPRNWLKATDYALRTGDWKVLSDDFIQKTFVGPDGYFLLVAPHQLSREAGATIELSAILGQILMVEGMPTKQVEKQVLETFGILHQPIVDVIPFNCLAACGHFGQENSEAFIVPESWLIPDSDKGSSLNNMSQHRQRFHETVEKNVPEIFEPKTAELLLESLADETVGVKRQHVEYQYHDAGHSTGLGIRRKIQDNLLPTYWCGGIEEWRADGVEFELAASTLPQEELGRLVAANLCLRLGVDAQRWGGSDFDGHATASLLVLEYLFKSSALCIKENKLALRYPSYQSLAWAVEMHRSEAVRLTREELSLEHPTGIIGRYQSVQVHQATREIFQNFVANAC